MCPAMLMLMLVLVLVLVLVPTRRDTQTSQQGSCSGAGSCLLRHTKVHVTCRCRHRTCALRTCDHRRRRLLLLLLLLLSRCIHSPMPLLGHCHSMIVLGHSNSTATAIT